MYFSLRTQNESEREQANKIIKEITKTFKENQVEISDYDLWVSIDIKNVNGWVGFNYVKPAFHIVSNLDSDKVVVIDINNMETLYVID